MRKQPQPLSGYTHTPYNGQNKPKPPPPAPPKPLREGSEKRSGTNPYPTTPRPTIPPPAQGTINYEKLLEMLLLKVNRVTCYHRHGNPIPKDALDELTEYQNKLEEIIDND